MYGAFLRRGAKKPDRPQLREEAGGVDYAPTADHIAAAERHFRLPAGTQNDITALMTAAGDIAERFMHLRLLSSENFAATYYSPAGLCAMNLTLLPNKAAEVDATRLTFKPDIDGAEVSISGGAAASAGGYSYWARKILEIPGMTNRAEAGGNTGDVTPARLLFAEKTDATTGATGINYYTIYSESEVTPLEGSDLYRGPFYTNYEGTVAFSRDVTEDRFPTVLIRTTHMIPGESDIVSVRAVPTGGLLVGLNEAESIGLSSFNSMVNLARDVPNGGKIGLKIELAIVLHNDEAARNTFMRKIQAGETINAGEAPAANKALKISFANTAVSFIQWGGGGGATRASGSNVDAAVWRIDNGYLSINQSAAAQIDKANTAGEIKISNYRGGLFANAAALPSAIVTALADIALRISETRGQNPDSVISMSAYSVLSRHRRILA